MSVFSTLNSINVNEHTEKKNGLTYLSWAWAWAEVKKAYPDATYEVKKFDGLPYVFDPKTGYMVYTTVTIDGITHEMWLPVMDGANNAMKPEPYEYTVKNPNRRYAKQQEDGRWIDKYGNEQPEFYIKTVQAATMFDVNKTIMRCLVKNLAMFGLGLYIYAGEDLPDSEDGQEKPVKKSGKEFKPAPKKTDDPTAVYEPKIQALEAFNPERAAQCREWVKEQVAAGTPSGEIMEVLQKAVESEGRRGG